jgi:hypothetical protein
MRKLLEVLFVSLCVIGVLGACKRGGREKRASEGEGVLRGEDVVASSEIQEFLPDKEIRGIHYHPLGQKDIIEKREYSPTDRKTKEAAYKKMFNELISIWNEAHTNKDVDVLKTLYDTIVYIDLRCGPGIGYHMQYTVDECIESKVECFEKYSDFSQRLEGEISIDSFMDDVEFVDNEAIIRSKRPDSDFDALWIWFPNGKRVKDELVKINFTKAMTDGKKEEKIESYLIFRKDKGTWKIFAESDLMTDRLLAPRAEGPTVAGDFNGDGIVDYMWLEMFEFNGEGEIRFSGDIPPLILDYVGLGGIPFNEGDLNDDGTDEIGFRPTPEMGVGKMHHVYTFKKNKWVELLSVYIRQEHLAEVYPVVKDSTRKGYVIINSSEWIDTDDYIGHVIKTESVKLK